MKVEISDAHWEAIKKVAQRYGLPAQVVLDHILDEVLGHGLNPTELRLLDLGLLRAPEEARIGPSTANRAPTADEMLAALYAETGAIADDEPAATAVRAAEESLAHLRSRLQDIAEPFHQDPSHYEDADYNYEDADYNYEDADDDGRDGDIADAPALADFFNYDFDYEPEFD